MPASTASNRPSPPPASAPPAEVTGRIHSRETLGAVDGPGLRYVLFLQGCGLRCRYCHNPDTWQRDGGQTATVTQIADDVLRYRRYFGRAGGITVSGGEPLLQPEFVTALFTRLRDAGIHTALDTAGAPYRADDARYDALLAVTDLVLLDIKHIDDGACRALTGQGNAATLALAERLSAAGIPLWIRYVLVPGLTDGEDDLRRTRQYLDGLRSLARVEVLPYHTLGCAKYERLGIPYPLTGVPTPTATEVARATHLLGADR